MSDLHANWYALEAVLAHANGRYDQVVCCGDLVGYNPHPARVVDWTRECCTSIVRGNHDKVVAGIEGLEWFNEVAQIAARWTIQQLDPAQLEYLRDLPAGPVEHDGFHLWHGSPRDEDEYVTGPHDPGALFSCLQLPLGFFGHTHLQGTFFSKQRRVSAYPAIPKNRVELAIELEPDTLYMVNPGSVGQPRDGDPRAGYALLDTDENVCYLRRVPYPFEKTAEEIRQAGLPDILGERLQYGL